LGLVIVCNCSEIKHEFNDADGDMVEQKQPNNITIRRIQPVSARPGMMITLSGDFPDSGNIFVHFEQYKSIPLSRSKDTIKAIVPIMPQGIAEIIVKTETYSSNVAKYQVDEAVKPIFSPVKLANVIGNGTSSIVGDVQYFVVTELSGINILTQEQLDNLLNRLSQIQLMNDAIVMKLQDLPVHESNRLEILLRETGVIEAFEKLETSRNNRKQTSSLQEPKYSTHWALLTLDILSAAVSVIQSAMPIVNIALVGICGPCAGAGLKIEAVLEILSGIFDTLIPSNLESIYTVPPNQTEYEHPSITPPSTISVLKDQSAEIKHYGNFTAEKDFVYGSIDFAISSILLKYFPPSATNEIEVIAEEIKSMIKAVIGHKIYEEFFQNEILISLYDVPLNMDFYNPEISVVLSDALNSPHIEPYLEILDSIGVSPDDVWGLPLGEKVYCSNEQICFYDSDCTCLKGLETGDAILHSKGYTFVDSGGLSGIFNIKAPKIVEFTAQVKVEKQPPNCSEICSWRNCGTFEDCNCGSCNFDEKCENHQCQQISCNEICDWRECSTYEGCSCGSCVSNEICENYQCNRVSCSEICDWRDCGTYEGCSCGNCDFDEKCESNKCIEIDCDEICENKECGEYENCDCGQCDDWEYCDSFQCENCGNYEQNCCPGSIECKSPYECVSGNCVFDECTVHQHCSDETCRDGDVWCINNCGEKDHIVFTCENGCNTHDECDKVLQDPSSRLMWQNSGTRSTGPSWDWAVDKCKGMEFYGFNDWHLPSVNEFRTLIMGCPNTEDGGDCVISNSCSGLPCYDSSTCEDCSNGGGPADGDCYFHSDFNTYGSCREYWTSTERSDNPDNAWYYNSINAYFYNTNKDGYKKAPYAKLIMCVRKY